MTRDRRMAPAALLPGWERLRHGGLLFDGPRLAELAAFTPAPLDPYTAGQLRQRAAALLAGGGDRSRFAAFVLERVCGLDEAAGTWTRGSRVAPAWGRRAVTGQNVKPAHLWRGRRGALLPVFLDGERRLGVGRGRRSVSHALGWLRAGGEHLALVTNGRQWRLLFAGLDYDAWCEWDLELWFDEGELAPQVTALRTLLSAKLWTPPAEGAAPPLLQAVRDARKGQAELSEVLGERVREAVELLIRSHGEALRELTAATPQEIYRAACRVAMRLVVILFAESRDLLPRGNAVYHDGYGLGGLLEQLERGDARFAGGADAYAAWPRVLALFRLVRDGSHHPELPVTAYGGELFEPGAEVTPDGVERALAVFEGACFRDQILPDREVREMLRLLTRTTIRIRQGRAATRAVTPVDFSDLSSEYLGVLYEGLLDYELKTAPDHDPVIFLSVGDQPALPLSRLEAMNDAALKALFESLKGGGEAPPAGEPPAGEPETEDPAAAGSDDDAAAAPADDRQRGRTRAETWARRAAQAAGLVRRRRGRDTPERRLAHERELALTARRLVARVVLPGEWYLVRWGGTRKGSGSFYTRPGLAVPTVQRTLRPLAYDPPAGADGAPDRDAAPARWTPKPPERILALTVCDPACGSGTFPLAALRFLTDALYASLQHHRRITPDPGGGARSLVRLLGIDGGPAPGGPERLIDELIPCGPEDDEFEPRLKAVLRRHVVERCLYAVDLDPLAVELCRLALWIETMDRTLPFGFLDHKVKCGNALLGAWFDSFLHYPVMAWKNRDGGDRTHANGAHFAKDARSKALRGFVKERLTPDLRRFLRGPDLFQPEDLLKQASAAHDALLAVLAGMHALPVQDAAERARRYRDDLIGTPAWRALREAMDRWCACWFWPPDQLACAPLPTTFAAPPPRTQLVAAQVAAELRFFHWELEFPDVFRAPGAGFDAILGNPPWDIAKPASQEFFSNVDPLYRSYGKQEALRRQAGYFVDQNLERGWLDYNARFRAQSNFAAHAAHPFGDPEAAAKSQDRFAAARGHENRALHDRWQQARRRAGAGYADPAHPFRHQGAADLNLYKLFLEAAHALLRPGGRLGFIVPSGLYSDHGTRALRTLFLEKCRWEWLFGIENRDKVFPIHRSYKFNPVVVEKGGETGAIRTAFMRRNLDDWERAEELATRYSRAQIARFSPRSRAILEIQSPRDLEILEKIYANSVLLGDDGPGGWGIRYATEFHMTGDSRLFPPRPQWEAKGYRPDEYSRWLLGDWRPIEELWAELGVDPARPQPVEPELAGWLFDAAAGPERRAAEARFLHGRLLKPGDAARTDWRLRCAAPPYDRLPLPRAALPPGIILSRDAGAYLREDQIRAVALPLYEGRMIGQFDYSQKGWVSGKGRTAVWRDVPWTRKQIEPQFLMAVDDYRSAIDLPDQPKVLHMRIASATNIRTAIATFALGMPAGDKAAAFYTRSLQYTLVLTAILNTLVFDFAARSRLIGLNLDYHVLDQSPLPAIDHPDLYRVIADLSARLSANPPWYSCLENGAVSVSIGAERARHLAILNALVADQYRVTSADLRRIIADCDLPAEHLKRRTHGTGLDPKGFWRVDQDDPPERRHPVLTLIALHDLEAAIEAAGGDRERGIRAFLSQNGGAGWLLPETLRLADYGLGRDDRARHPQPVASRLGPRFYDYQLAQTAAEAQRESHLHARNLLGSFRYESLRRGDPYSVPDEQRAQHVAEPGAQYSVDSSPDDGQADLFASDDPRTAT